MTITLEGPAIEETLERAGRAREAFLRLTAARAQRDAERATGGVGPLAGVPFAVKDVFDVRGTRTTGASQLYDHRLPARNDAEAVRRLSDAGAVCIGKTTMSELAYSGLGVNERFGTPTIRREGREYLVGGSSSGAAAAVRAGIVPIALASDTSGSARIPAAWAGVAGFRPSLGRYSSAGMLGLAPTLDTVGVIADRVSRLAVVDRVLSGATGGAEASSTPAFVIPHDEYLASCDPLVLERFHQDVERLRSLGLRVARRRFTSLDAARELHGRHLPIVEAEALAAFGPHLDREPGRFGPAVRRRLERARSRRRDRSPAPLYESMALLRARYSRELGDAFLVSPPTEIDAPMLDQVDEAHSTHDELNRRALSLTMVLSYLDAPSVVVPSAGSDGRESTIQISGRAGADHHVLRAAALVEDAYPIPTPITASPFKGETR